MSANNKQSILVSTQVPKFVRDEHEKFVSFLEYYYKFLEGDGQPNYVLRNLTKFLDVDIIAKDVLEDLENQNSHNVREETAYHAFLQKLYDSYIRLIPDNVLADRNIILKHAKDFYRSTGSEKSVQFLIRALFNKEADLYYPKTDIIKASDGKWFIEKSLRVADIEVGVLNANGEVDVYEPDTTALIKFDNHTVRGNTTNAAAVVERSVVFYENGRLVNELKISGEIGDFQNGEYVFADFEEEGVIKRVRAGLFSGIINSINILDPGVGYAVGDIVPVVSESGGGAVIQITKVTKGGIRSIGILGRGAGFKSGDLILATGGGGGFGANGVVLTVDNSGNTHPNSYNLVGTTIDIFANDIIGNTSYTAAPGSNANTAIANAMYYWTYSNCGPVLLCLTTNTGEGYTELPILNIDSNTRIRSLGVLGAMEIINGGSNYASNDVILFENVDGGYGSGARGEVASVNGTGAITSVRFIPFGQEIVGGTGYEKDKLPLANVQSTYGSGANVIVTAILGDSEQLFTTTDTAGAIREITIVSGGEGYLEPPYLNFDAIGTGVGAVAVATVASGVFKYPGRYLNDDGQVSSYNFIQDRDYYQNYSYVVMSNQSINSYRKPLTDLVHPMGTKMFGEYLAEVHELQDATINTVGDLVHTPLYSSEYVVQGYENGDYNVNIVEANTVPFKFKADYRIDLSNTRAQFFANGSIIDILNNDRNLASGDNVFFILVDYNYFNPAVVPGFYTVQSSNATQFSVELDEGYANNYHGNCAIYSLDMVFTAVGHGLRKNDNVFIRFDSSNTSLSNSFYSIKKATAFTFTIENLNVATIAANANAGFANISTNTMTIYANTHGFRKGDEAYIRFTSGDTANTPNGYYYIPIAPEANTFNIKMDNVVFSNGTAYLHTKGITVNTVNFTANNGTDVYISFSAGDLMNSEPGVYSIDNFNESISGNTFTVDLPVPLTSNGNVFVYTQNVTYNVATVTRANHMFEIGNTVYTEFDSPNLLSSLYTVTDVIDANTYNIADIEFSIYRYDTKGNVSVGLYK